MKYRRLAGSRPAPPFAYVRELQLALHTLVLPCRLHDTSFVACQHGPVGSGTTTVTGIGDVNVVARDGFNACMKGDVICVPGVVNQAAVLASRSTPKWLLRRVAGLLGRQLG